jgi:hypothetical protein
LGLELDVYAINEGRLGRVLVTGREAGVSLAVAVLRYPPVQLIDRRANGHGRLIRVVAPALHDYVLAAREPRGTHPLGNVIQVGNLHAHENRAHLRRYAEVILVGAIDEAQEQVADAAGDVGLPLLKQLCCLSPGIVFSLVGDIRTTTFYGTRSKTQGSVISSDR